MIKEPWTLDKNGYMYEITGSDGRLVAQVTEKYAAWLMVAAPQLLEALKNFANCAMPNDPRSPEFLDRVHNLIDKAEGK